MLHLCFYWRKVKIWEMGFDNVITHHNLSIKIIMIRKEFGIYESANLLHKTIDLFYIDCTFIDRSYHRRCKVYYHSGQIPNLLSTLSLSFIGLFFFLDNSSVFVLASNCLVARGLQIIPSLLC